jgi:hypothetical protein
MSRGPVPPTASGAVLAFTGMVAFISGVAAYPRLTLTRDDNFTTLRYQHRHPTLTGRTPLDPGLIIAPGPREGLHSSTSSSDNRPTSSSGRPFTDKDWILDTGANCHVCTDASRMHGYTSFAHSSLMKSAAHFGPNPISVAGIGDCTLTLSQPDDSALDVHSIGREASVKRNLTISDVSHIPTAGINIISWSKLRQARGLNLRLRDHEDGSLRVVSVDRRRSSEREMMRFIPRGGLYFLDHRS